MADKVKDNPKMFWKYINSKLTIKPGVTKLKQPNGQLTTNDLEKANVLNDYFCSVFTKEDTTTLPSLVRSQIKTELGQLVIDPDQVRKKLAKMNPNKAPGNDGHHPKVYKELADILALPLATIFQKALEEGCVPLAWRSSVVTPIFKKGAKNQPSNYRPVGLTSIACKVPESLNRDHIMTCSLHTNMAFFLEDHVSHSSLKC